MTTEEIDIYCSRCHTRIGASTNEWRQLGGSLIAPVQKTWYKAIKIAQGQGFLPMEAVPEELHRDIGSEASCAHCENIIGQGFKDAGVVDAAAMDRCVAECSTIISAWLISRK